MRHFTVFSLFLCTMVVLAQDKDTIPLTKKNNSQLSERLLLQPGGSKPGPAPAEPISSESETKDIMPVIEGPNATEDAKPYVASIGVYGTTRLNEVTLKEFLGKDLDTWLAKGLENDPDSEALEKKLAEKVKAKFGFVETGWSIIQYYQPGNFGIHVTLDVVEPADVFKRMNFLKAPSEQLVDPDNLIQAWMLYQDTAWDLVDKRELEPEADKCASALHCPFGHSHSQLKKFEKIFVDGVRKNESALATILSNDKRENWRASAAFLLAYSKNANQVISLLVDRIRDPEAIVRNNAMRVLGDIAEFHQEYLIPVEPVIQALDFPKTSDRNKAVYLLYLLSLNSSKVRDTIRTRALKPLLLILASKQPDHREFAHEILRKISGKNYAAADVTAWSNWTQRLPATK